MEMLRVMAESGDQSHKIFVGCKLYREPWSWPDLTSLRDLCHRFFRLKPMVPGSQYPSQFLVDCCIPSDSETFRLMCASLYDPLVVKES